MKTGDDGKHDKDGNRNPRRLWPVVVDVCTTYAAYQRRKYQKPEDPLSHRIGYWARFNALATLGGAVLAGVAAFIFYLQLGATQGQLDAMRDEQRAWISIAGTTHGDLSWNDGGGDITVNFDLRNVGKSPAFGTHFEARAVIPEFPEQSDDTITREYIADLDRRMDERKSDGQTYFPDSGPFNAGQRLSLDRKKIVAYLAAAKTDGLLPKIVACAVYHSANSTEFRHTCITGYMYVADSNGSHAMRLDESASAQNVILNKGFFSYAD